MVIEARRLRRVARRSVDRLGAVSGIDVAVGRRRPRSTHRSNLLGQPAVDDAIQLLERIAPQTCDDQPVFVLSAGWRSGSTLLQRLIMSSGDIFVWGEPYDHCDIVRRLADSLRAFNGRWPKPEAILDGVSELQDTWIANLYPPPPRLIEAHRALFSHLFGSALHGSQYRRWGIKEVRLGADDARYLRLLYPDAKFVFLHRSPYEAYRSYYRLDQVWYDSWPARPILRPAQFGELWRRLVTGFHDAADELDALIVRYDDLVSDERTVKEIEAYLDVSVDRGVLESRITGPRAVTRTELPRLQRYALRRAVEPVASTLGY